MVTSANKRVTNANHWVIGANEGHKKVTSANKRVTRAKNGHKYQ